MTGAADNSTGKLPSLKARLRAYLEAHCVGAANRHPARMIAKELGLPERDANWAVHRAMQRLRLEDGMPIASVDKGEDPGIWLAEDPDDLDACLYALHARIGGEARTFNAILAIRRGKWPLHEFPPKSEREIAAMEELSRLPDGYRPVTPDRRADDYREGTRERANRERYRKSSKRHVLVPPAAVVEMVCTECGVGGLLRTWQEGMTYTHVEQRGCGGKLKRAEAAALTG